MICPRCQGKVMRVFDEYSCINCGAEQTPGAAVSLEVVKMGREPGVMLQGLPRCKCGGVMSSRNKTGLCKACCGEATKRVSKRQHVVTPAQREVFEAQMNVTFTKVTT